MASQPFTPQPFPQHLSRSRHSENKISAYANLLVEISNGLSDTEYSQLRMVLCVDHHIKASRQGHVQNIADLLEFMNTKKLINRVNLTMLKNMLKPLGRDDLIAKVIEYENIHIVSSPPSRNHPIACVDDERERSRKVGDSNDGSSLEEDNLPGSQDSMKSLSDDEKLWRAGQASDKFEILEWDDVNMNSQGSN